MNACAVGLSKSSCVRAQPILVNYLIAYLVGIGSGILNMRV